MSNQVSPTNLVMLRVRGWCIVCKDKHCTGCTSDQMRTREEQSIWWCLETDLTQVFLRFASSGISSTRSQRLHKGWTGRMRGVVMFGGVTCRPRLISTSGKRRYRLKRSYIIGVRRNFRHSPLKCTGEYRLRFRHSRKNTTSSGLVYCRWGRKIVEIATRRAIH